jgi:hypothetical protein
MVMNLDFKANAALSFLEEENESRNNSDKSGNTERECPTMGVAKQG